MMVQASFGMGATFSDVVGFRIGFAFNNANNHLVVNLFETVKGDVNFGGGLPNLNSTEDLTIDVGDATCSFPKIQFQQCISEATHSFRYRLTTFRYAPNKIDDGVSIGNIGSIGGQVNDVNTDYDISVGGQQYKFLGCRCVQNMAGSLLRLSTLLASGHDPVLKKIFTFGGPARNGECLIQIANNSIDLANATYCYSNLSNGAFLSFPPHNLLTHLGANYRNDFADIPEWKGLTGNEILSYKNGIMDDPLGNVDEIVERVTVHIPGHLAFP